MKLLVTVLITGHGHRNRHHPAGLAHPGQSRGKLTGPATIPLAASQE
jgi:hypothetical protein